MGSSQDYGVGPLSSWYLLNPFGVLTCVGCSLSSFENLFVIISVYGVVSHQPFLSAFSLVLASYVGLHPVLFMVTLEIHQEMTSD